jgi:hypothetical protein
MKKRQRPPASCCQIILRCSEFDAARQRHNGKTGCDAGQTLQRVEDQRTGRGCHTIHDDLSDEITADHDDFTGCKQKQLPWPFHTWLADKDKSGKKAHQAP